MYKSELLNLYYGINVILLKHKAINEVNEKY